MDIINCKLQDEIRCLIRDIVPEVKQLRHELHQIPEIAGNEFKTSAKVRKFLQSLPGFEVKDPYLETDVVALLHGNKPGKCVALRADMDALPLTEPPGKSYVSTHPGLMHACGHDGHTAMLLGAAVLLSKVRDRFSGTIRFVFQPGEERAFMGKALVAAGALDNPNTDYVFALHNWPDVPYGVIGTRVGPVMASGSSVKAVIHGRGGHISTPELANNPLEGAAALILKVKEIRQLLAKKGVNASIAFSVMQGSQSSNVIPNEAFIQGSCRVFDMEVSDWIFDLLRKGVAEIESETGLKIDLIIRNNYHILNNDAKAVEIALQAAELSAPLVKKGEIIAEPRRASEDFCYYTEHTRGAFAFLGYGPNGVSLHSENYDFDDTILPAGVAYLSFCALCALESNL